MFAYHSIGIVLRLQVLPIACGRSWSLEQVVFLARVWCRIFLHKLMLPKRNRMALLPSPCVPMDVTS
jgi:hypothetical protein